MEKKQFAFYEQLTTRIKAGIIGGGLAGTFLGFFEAWAIIAKNWETVQFSILPYATVLYTLTGIAMGLGIGIGLTLFAAIIRRTRSVSQVFCFIAPVVFVLNGLVIARYRIIRDVLKEQPLSKSGHLWLAATGIVLFFVLFFILHFILSHSRSHHIYSPLHVSGIIISLIVVAFITMGVFNLLKRTPPPPKAHSAQPVSVETPTVVLIMIDALRADFLSCYGYKKPISPRMDAFAQESILFVNSFAQASWTRASTATLFTSLYPSTHQAYRKSDVLPDAVTTIAETMAEGGYYTIGYADNINIAPIFNFQQGFHEYHYLSPDYFFFASASSSQLAYYSVLRILREKFLFKGKKVNHYYQDAEVVTDRATNWISKNEDKGKFFMYLHYMEPHDPYFSHPYNGVAYARVTMEHPDPKMREPFIEAYESEIQYLDTYLGKLFDFLKSKGMYDNAMIIITADHGEEFYDHQGWWHGTTLYDEQIRVPLIIKLPAGEQAGSRVTGLARLLDVAPTILNRTGLEIPHAMQGQPLLPRAKESASTEFVFSEEDFEGNIIKALRTSDWKLLRANENNPRKLPTAELYNVAQDPLEKENKYTTTIGKVQEMDLQLQQHVKTALSQSVASDSADIDDSIREQMQNLGYAVPGRSDSESDGE